MNLPPFLKMPMAVAEFRMRIFKQRPHQELTFTSIVQARKQYRDSQKKFALKADYITAHLDDRSEWPLIYENAALQSLYTDLGGTLILIAAASLERFFRAVGESVLNRGVTSYATGVTFSQAIHSLANQYKHYGEWTHNGPRSETDANIVNALVDDPLREDAASEFLERSRFTDYVEFQDSLVSCSNGLADPLLMPDGMGSLPTITLRGAKSQVDGDGQQIT